MDGVSPIHMIMYVLILPIWLLIVGIPIAKILGRLGYSRALVVLAILPVINIVALWVLAGASWPILKQRGPNA